MQKNKVWPYSLKLKDLNGNEVCDAVLFLKRVRKLIDEISGTQF